MRPRPRPASRPPSPAGRGRRRTPPVGPGRAVSAATKRAARDCASRRNAGHCAPVRDQSEGALERDQSEGALERDQGEGALERDQGEGALERDAATAPRGGERFVDLSKDFAEIFERIYVINLDSRPDRLRGIAAQFARVGLTIDGPLVRRVSAVRPSEQGDWPSIGARGCFMSQLSALRDARDEGLRCVAVVEDDFDFSPSLLAEPGRYFDPLRSPDWRMLHAGRPADTPGARAWRPAAQDVLYHAHFVGFRGEIIPRIVEHLEQVAARPKGHGAGGPMHVDGAYQIYREAHPETQTLAFDPPMGVQRSSASDITPVWHDRAPFVRNLAGLARRVLKSS